MTQIINTENKSQANGLILAGGRATRMGNVDKGLIRLNGKTLIEHCITKLQPQVDKLFISANQNIEQYEKYGFMVLKDNFGEFEGPLAGLLRALENSKNNPVLVVPCDAPLFPNDLAARLLDVYVEGETSAIIPYDGKRLQTLFGLYSTDTISSLIEYLDSGQRKVEAWASSLSHVIVDVSSKSDYFLNINTNDDLQTAHAAINNS